MLPISQYGLCSEMEVHIIYVSSGAEVERKGEIFSLSVHMHFQDFKNELFGREIPGSE